MNHDVYMQRCLQLAHLGVGYVTPNPLVGAVLVHNEIIIGEGYHQKYGEAHAEVNCLQNVKETHQSFIASSTLYVSLEPCAHYGKTPPCVDLILQYKIPRVVIGCSDPFSAVNGKSIQKLKTAGVEVTVGVLEKECKEINKYFFHYHKNHQPYIILKWAQTSDKFIAHNDYKSISISNAIVNRLAHKWRSGIASILVGTNTAYYDNPLLTNRFWNKELQPIRLVIDKELKVPQTHHLFNKDAPIIIFNNIQHKKEGNIQWYKIDNQNIPQQICNALYQLGIQSMLIEGGSALLQSFINAGLWNDAIVITNRNLYLQSGVSAPLLIQHIYTHQDEYDNNIIEYYQKKYR